MKTPLSVLKSFILCVEINKSLIYNQINILLNGIKKYNEVIIWNIDINHKAYVQEK